jgi:hypothetical protein
LEEEDDDEGGPGVPEPCDWSKLSLSGDGAGILKYEEGGTDAVEVECP